MKHGRESGHQATARKRGRFHPQSATACSNETREAPRPTERPGRHVPVSATGRGRGAVCTRCARGGEAATAPGGGGQLSLLFLAGFSFHFSFF